LYNENRRPLASRALDVCCIGLTMMTPQRHHGVTRQLMQPTFVTSTIPKRTLHDSLSIEVNHH